MYNHKSLKIVSLLILITILGIFVAYYFVYIDIKNKNINHHMILHDLSFQGGKQDYLNSMQQTINNLDSKIKLIDDSIIVKGEEVQFIESLEAVARESGLIMEINSLVLDEGPKQASSSISILKIYARTKGSWAGSYKFLSRLESLPFKIKVNNFGLTNTSPESISANDNNVVPGDNWQGVFAIDVLESK